MRKRCNGGGKSTDFRAGWFNACANCGEWDDWGDSCRVAVEHFDGRFEVMHWRGGASGPGVQAQGRAEAETSP